MVNKKKVLVHIATRENGVEVFLPLELSEATIQELTKLGVKTECHA